MLIVALVCFLTHDSVVSATGLSTTFDREFKQPNNDPEDRVSGALRVTGSLHHSGGSSRKSVCSQADVENWCMRLASGDDGNGKERASEACGDVLANTADETQDYDSCYIPQYKLNRCLMEASTTCEDDFSCLEEMQRQMVADCALCLSARQQILLPAMEPVDYKRTAMAEHDAAVPRAEPRNSAADCTHRDIEMFCLRDTFPAQFYKHSLLFQEGTKVCFPWLQSAQEKCQVSSRDLDRAYMHATNDQDRPSRKSWAQDYPKYVSYMTKYQEAREILVRKCRSCVARAIPETKKTLRNGEHFILGETHSYTHELHGV